MTASNGRRSKAASLDLAALAVDLAGDDRRKDGVRVKDRLRRPLSRLSSLTQTPPVRSLCSTKRSKAKFSQLGLGAYSYRLRSGPERWRVWSCAGLVVRFSRKA